MMPVALFALAVPRSWPWQGSVSEACQPKAGPAGSTSRTASALATIEKAHAAVAAGQYASLEAALVGQRDGVLPAAPLPSRGDLITLTLGDLAERVTRLETTLLSERDDYKRRLDDALAELRNRDEVQQPRRWWFRS